MIKILNLKKSIADIKKEENKIKKDGKKLIKQKEKILKKQIEILFLESIRELKWTIEIVDKGLYFGCIQERPNSYKNRNIAKKAIFIPNRTLGGLLPSPKKRSAAATNSLYNNYMYNTKFGNLYKFIEIELESPFIRYDKFNIELRHNGFIIPIYFLTEEYKYDDSEDNLNLLNNFLFKTKITLDLKDFNTETERLENELTLRKKILDKNSNAFLFGL